MEPTNRHPLACITNNSSLSMLECLIPFVDQPLKLPLALLIKFNEIQLIFQTFQSAERLTNLGLNHCTSDPLELLCAISGIPKEMLQLLATMSSDTKNNTTDLFNTLSSFSNIDPSLFSQMKKHDNEMPPENNTLDDTIAQLFAEYDLTQAQQFNSHINNANSSDNSNSQNIN